MNIDEFTQSRKHLPKFMRSFSQQKLLFRFLDVFVKKSQNKHSEKPFGNLANLPNEVNAHIYVIDFFLEAMARSGYTLQKNRTRIRDFNDLPGDLLKYKHILLTTVPDQPNLGTVLEETPWKNL